MTMLLHFCDIFHFPWNLNIMIHFFKEWSLFCLTVLCHGQEGTAARDWCSWLLPLQAGSREKWVLMLSSVSFFHWVWDMSLWYGPIHIPGGSSLSTHLENSLIDLLEACLLGDYRSCQVDNVSHMINFLRIYFIYLMICVCVSVWVCIHEEGWVTQHRC